MKVKASEVLPGQKFRLGGTEFLMLECCDYAQAIKELDGLSDSGRIAVDLELATIMCFEGGDEVEI